MTGFTHDSRRRLWLVPLVSLAAALSLVAPASASPTRATAPGTVAKYVFTTIDVPDALGTELIGVNNLGQVSGTANMADGSYGFIGDPATDSYTTFQAPDADLASGGTLGFGLNDAGAVVGAYYDQDGFVHGYLRDGSGGFTAIDVPGGSDTQAIGINLKGAVVGTFDDGTGEHGFLRSPGGSYTQIDVPGATTTDAYGINASGTIVGTQIRNGQTEGFVRTKKGVFTTYIMQSYTGTFLWGVNKAGSLVGWVTDAQGVHSLTWPKGDRKNPKVFDPKGWPNSQATGITDKSVVAGFCDCPAGLDGYLRTKA